jgi:hypothetical protein
VRPLVVLRRHFYVHVDEGGWVGESLKNELKAGYAIQDFGNE